MRLYVGIADCVLLFIYAVGVCSPIDVAFKVTSTFIAPLIGYVNNIDIYIYSRRYRHSDVLHVNKLGSGHRAGNCSNGCNGVDLANENVLSLNKHWKMYGHCMLSYLKVYTPPHSKQTHCVKREGFLWPPDDVFPSIELCPEMQKRLGVVLRQANDNVNGDMTML